ADCSHRESEPESPKHAQARRRSAQRNKGAAEARATGIWPDAHLRDSELRQVLCGFSCQACSGITLAYTLAASADSGYASYGSAFYPALSRTYPSPAING